MINLPKKFNLKAGVISLAFYAITNVLPVNADDVCNEKRRELEKAFENLSMATKFASQFTKDGSLLRDILTLKVPAEQAKNLYDDYNKNCGVVTGSLRRNKGYVLKFSE